MHHAQSQGLGEEIKKQQISSRMPTVSSDAWAAETNSGHENQHEEILLPKSCDSEPLLPPAGRNGRLPRRYVVAAMLCAGFINAYAMRTNLSVAVDTMQKRYSWSNEVEGNVLSAFFWVGCMF